MRINGSRVGRLVNLHVGESMHEVLLIIFCVEVSVGRMADIGRCDKLMKVSIPDRLPVSSRKLLSVTSPPFGDCS